MKSIGKSKITKLRPKKNIEYPLIRLPQSHSYLAGETAYIFEIENNGKPLFVLSLDENFDGNFEVIQPVQNPDIESRLESIEKYLAELQETIPREVLSNIQFNNIKTPPHLGTTSFHKTSSSPKQASRDVSTNIQFTDIEPSPQIGITPSNNPSSIQKPASKDAVSNCNSDNISNSAEVKSELSCHNNEKELSKSLESEKKNCGGPDEIRTHDPRRVKAMS